MAIESLRGELHVVRLNVTDEEKHRAEFDSVCERAHDESSCDDREGKLKGSVYPLWDGGTELMSAVGSEAPVPQSRTVTDEFAAAGVDGRAESKRVSAAHPEEGDEAGDREGLHDTGEDVLDAHHARVVEAEARDGHHEHDGSAHDHEGGVTSRQGTEV